MKPDSKIQELHASYCSISGMDVALRFNRESSWVEFTRAGFTKADLEAVLKRLIGLVKTGDRRPECLKFSNVVEGLDRFEEELAMIKAEANGLRPVEREMSVMELHRVLECKQVNYKSLVNSHTHEDAFGLVWDNPEAKNSFKILAKEIRVLQDRIAGMA